MRERERERGDCRRDTERWALVLVKAEVGLKVERREVSERRDRVGPVLKARRKHAQLVRISSGSREVGEQQRQ